MTRRSSLLAAVAVVAALTFAAGARADIVATLPPGSYFTDVSVAPTGAVWVASSGPTHGQSGIGTVGPLGVHLTTLAITGQPLGGTSDNAVWARPDGGVWGFFGGRVAIRSTATSFATTALLSRGEYESSAGVPADGSALVMSDGAESFVRLGLDGTKTTVRYSAPKSAGQSNCSPERFATPPDGTLYVSDGCRRIVHLRLDGSVLETIPLTGALDEWSDFPRVLAGPSTDLWISGDSSLSHRVGGVVTKVTLPEFQGFLGPEATAPDGSLWIAEAQGCSLLHVTAGGVQQLPAPITASALTVAPDGTLWMTNRNQLAHVGPAGERGSCDQRQPKVRLTDVHHGRVSVAALRRRHGLRMTSDEPGTLIGAMKVKGATLMPQQSIDRHGTTLRFSQRQLASVAHGGRLDVRYLQVWDANNNGGGPAQDTVRVVP
jgi:streptogramin lyase